MGGDIQKLSEMYPGLDHERATRLTRTPELRALAVLYPAVNHYEMEMRGGRRPELSERLAVEGLYPAIAMISHKLEEEHKPYEISAAYRLALGAVCLG